MDRHYCPADASAAVNTDPISPSYSLGTEDPHMHKIVAVHRNHRLALSIYLQSQETMTSLPGGGWIGAGCA